MQLYFWRPRRAHDGVLAVERVDREHRLCADSDGELADLGHSGVFRQARLLYYYWSATGLRATGARALGRYGLHGVLWRWLATVGIACHYQEPPIRTP